MLANFNAGSRLSYTALAANHFTMGKKGRKREEAGEPGENPLEYGEDMQTPHRKAHGPPEELNPGPSCCEEDTVLTTASPCRSASQYSRKNVIHSKKRKHRKDEEVVKELCMANGVSYENIAHEGSHITSLEIFFTGFPRMVGLSFFPLLRRLTILGQDIKYIEGLECCPLLQELWVVQCHLTVISGLQNCLQLEKLYLYDNEINEITNLELLVKVEVLWLNNNCITHIQGLNKLQSLKELNLAGNIIEKIGHSLDHNVNLENLNLSGNKISSFKELTPIARLPRLTELALMDRITSPNPVCLLCNYAAHILYHMPGLQHLDTYDVSSKQVKEAAESTVTKKKMYYSMRVRSAQRTLAETRLSLMEKKKTLLQLPEECIRTLNHALKDLERELSWGCKTSACTLEDEPDASTNLLERSANKSDPPTDASYDPDMEPKMLFKMETVRERLAIWTRRLEEIEAWYKQELAQATKMTRYTVQFLSMELESVGNIRLEEGCSTDSWFTPCCDLLLSRFSQSDFDIYGITGIKVTRVIRIHNSALRLRFEDKLRSLLASKDSSVNSSRNYRRWLDYLFYVTDPEKDSEEEDILCVVEHGLKTAHQHRVNTTRQRKEMLCSLVGMEAAIPLSNSLSVSEQPRIKYALHEATQGNSSHRKDMVPFRNGQVIVSKVFVGKSMLVKEGEPVDRRSYPKICSVYLNVDTKHRTAMSEDRRYSSKTRADIGCISRHRQWFVFDPELVLSEYIIYFEYILMGQKEHAALAHHTDRNETSSNDVIKDKEVLNMEPVLTPKPKLLSLDDKILLNLARVNVLSHITVLNLHGNSLSKIKEISCLTALQHLTLSFNKFTHLNDISHMASLEFLDASFNHLVTLVGLRRLVKLKELDVSWNSLTNAREDTAVLKKHTPALLKLDTRYNCWKRPEAVRMITLGCVTTLTHLDELMVTEDEAAEAVQMAAGSKITQTSLLAHSRTNIDRPRSLSLISTVQLLCLLGPGPWGFNREPEPGWTSKITALNLDSQRISKMISLDKLENLRWASFNDNDISKVEGLDSCVKLEELYLNNNCISTFSGLSKLHCLTKLSVDGNQLSCLDASLLEQLPSLSFLSVENNCINSLRGVQGLGSCRELYLANNQISTSRDIYYMKGLTSVIILDLYGNPLLEKLENYRIYVVFHLPSLKALDGIAVEGTEHKSAKHMFGGRLTTDMVAEKLGHSNYTDMTFLTLQSCSIRVVDLSPADLFNSLRSVNLDHNNLTSFSGLIYLPNIKALSLNYNHIDSILPRQKVHLTNRQLLYHKVHSSGYGQQTISKANKEAGATASLEPLMGSLEVLHLSHNGISNMGNLQLSRLTNLKALFLQGNDISQVEGLEGLHKLMELVLDRNRIKTLTEKSFVGQNALLELHLAENRIRELNHLDPLTELRKLFLGLNKLQDITELDKLDTLPSLTELSVYGNPVARSSLHRAAVVLHLPQLQVLDGIMITLDERTRAELLHMDSSPCSQHSGVSLATIQIDLPGMLPLMPRNNLPKGMSLSGGLQTSVHGHDILPSNMDEAQSYTYKHKKHKCGNVTRSTQTEITFRNVLRTGSNLTSTGLLSDGNRVIITYPNIQQDSRFPNGGKPSTM